MPTTKGHADSWKPRTRLEVAGLITLGSGQDQAGASVPKYWNATASASHSWPGPTSLNQRLNRPGQGPWVNVLDPAQAVAAVRAARPQADIVVVSLHWGEEDRHEPTLGSGRSQPDCSRPEPT